MASSGRHDNADLAPDIAVADCGSGLRGLVPKHDRPGKLLRLQLQRAAASCSPPPPDAGAEVPDRGARNAGCNRNPQSHWARLRFAVCRCGLRRSAPRRKGLRLRLRCALAACGPLAPGKACPPRRALAAARCGCGLRRLGPWRGRGGGEVEMRLRRATAACEGWPPMEGGAHGAGPVLLRPRTKKALSGSVMGNYGRRGGVNKGLECVIAFAIVLVQSPSLPSELYVHRARRVSYCILDSGVPLWRALPLRGPQPGAAKQYTCRVTDGVVVASHSASRAHRKASRTVSTRER